MSWTSPHLLNGRREVRGRHPVKLQGITRPTSAVCWYTMLVPPLLGPWPWLPFKLQSYTYTLTPHYGPALPEPRGVWRTSFAQASRAFHAHIPISSHAASFPVGEILSDLQRLHLRQVCCLNCFYRITGWIAPASRWSNSSYVISRGYLSESKCHCKPLTELTSVYQESES
jgi:hypothetical protein